MQQNTVERFGTGSRTPGTKHVRKFSAFTLVELIVVITILAILATVGFLTLSGYTDDARSATVAANVRTVYSAILTESTTSGNSPRYYVDHDPAAALSGGIVFVDGGAVALTGGQWGSGGTNYSAGNPRWDRLKMNGEKFRLSAVLLGGLGGGNGAGFGGLADMAGAAYDTGSVSVGAFDYVGKAGVSGKPRTATYFQVAGVSPGTKKASVTGNYAAAWTGAALGLVKDPGSTSSTGAVVDGATANASATPSAYASCKDVKLATGTSTNGKYLIDPDGSGGNPPYEVLCEMSADGGGWTLVYYANTVPSSGVGNLTVANVLVKGLAMKTYTTDAAGAPVLANGTTNAFEQLLFVGKNTNWTGQKGAWNRVAMKPAGTTSISTTYDGVLNADGSTTLHTQEIGWGTASISTSSVLSFWNVAGVSNICGGANTPGGRNCPNFAYTTYPYHYDTDSERWVYVR